MGIEPGDHVAILGPTSRPLVTAIQGCWLAGAASMVLPLPMRMGSLEAFVESTRARIRHGDAKLLLIDDLLAAFYEAVPGDPPTRRPGRRAARPRPARSPRRSNSRPSTPSGSSSCSTRAGRPSEPKGVMIPDRVLGANIDAAVAGRRAGSDGDVLVSWLPLYHDMGLVGCLGIPMLNGIDLVQAAPQDFLAHPGHWMEWLSRYRGTATAGPNFSWVLATRALRRLKDLDLSPMRIALNGAEPIDPGAVEAFVAAAEPLRVPAGRRVPRLRHGRGRHRRRRSRRRCGAWCATPSTARCWSGIGSPSRSRSSTRTTRR